MQRLLIATLLAAPAWTQERLVAPEDAGSARRPAVDERVVVHDVKDLVAGGSMAELDLRKLGERIQEASGEELLELVEERERIRGEMRSRAEVLRSAAVAFLEPELADPARNLRILDGSTMLLLNGSPEQQVWMREFLQEQRRTSESLGVEPRMLEFETRILEVPAGLMATLGVEGSAALYADAAASSPVLEALEDHDEVQQVVAPRVVTRVGNRASLAVTDPVAYVEDYTLTVVEPGGREIADPTIGRVDEGVRVELWSVALEPEVYGVEVKLTQTTLERPIPTRTLLLGAGRHEVEIGLPEVTEVGLESRLAIRDGGTALVLTPDPSRQVDVVVALTVRSLDRRK